MRFLISFLVLFPLSALGGALHPFTLNPVQVTWSLDGSPLATQTITGSGELEPIDGDFTLLVESSPVVPRLLLEQVVIPDITITEMIFHPGGVFVPPWVEKRRETHDAIWTHELVVGVGGWNDDLRLGPAAPHVPLEVPYVLGSATSIIRLRWGTQAFGFGTDTKFFNFPPLPPCDSAWNCPWEGEVIALTFNGSGMLIDQAVDFEHLVGEATLPGWTGTLPDRFAAVLPPSPIQGGQVVGVVAHTPEPSTALLLALGLLGLGRRRE